MKCCTTCGQTLPEKWTFAAQFRGIKQQILIEVHKAGKHGIRSDVLFDRIYKTDPDGGPLTGVKILAVHVSQMNRTLKPQGWYLHSLNRGRCGFGHYVVEKTS